MDDDEQTGRVGLCREALALGQGRGQGCQEWGGSGGGNNGVRKQLDKSVKKENKKNNYGEVRFADNDKSYNNFFFKWEINCRKLVRRFFASATALLFLRPFSRMTSKSGE